MIDVMAAALGGLALGPASRWLSRALPEAIEREETDAVSRSGSVALEGAIAAYRGHWAFTMSRADAGLDLVLAAILALTLAVLGPDGHGWLIASATWVLWTLLLTDLRSMYLPDALTLPLLWAGLGLAASGYGVSPGDAIIGAILGYGFPWMIFHAYRLIRGVEGMGYGDFKLLAALGAWLGWTQIPYVLLVSALVAVAIMGATILSGKEGREKQFPFGPYIAIAGWIWLVWGQPLGERLVDLMS